MNLNAETIEFDKTTLFADIKKVLHISGKKLAFFVLLLALPAALIMGVKCCRYAEMLFEQWDIIDWGNETSVLLMLSEFSQMWGSTLPQLLLETIYEILIGVQIAFVIVITYEALQGGCSFAQSPSALIKLTLKKLLWVMLFYYLFQGCVELVAAPVVSFTISIAAGMGNFMRMTMGIFLVLWTISVMAMVFLYFPVMCACILFSRAKIPAVPYFSHYLLKNHFIKNFFQTWIVLFLQSVVVGLLMVIPVLTSVGNSAYAPLLWILWAVLTWGICAFLYLFYTVRFAYLEREGIMNLAKEGRVIFINEKGNIKRDSGEYHDGNENKK